MPLLEATGLTKRFGGVIAVNDFSMQIDRGEIVGLIGPNGAGKTTVFNLLTRITQPDEGTVSFWAQIQRACSLSKSPVKA